MADSFTAAPGEMSYDDEREPRMTPPVCERDPELVIKRLRELAQSDRDRDTAAAAPRERA